jgi:hypothetical protein
MVPVDVACATGPDVQQLLNDARQLLVPESEVRDELAITIDIGPLQVLEKTTTAPDHLEEAAAAVVVLPVCVEVGPKVVDTSREDRDLDGSASTIVLVELVLLDDVVFDNRHTVACLRESQSLQGKRFGCLRSPEV